MDSSKRRLSGAAPRGSAQKRPNAAVVKAVEEEPAEEPVAVLPESPQEDDAEDVDQHMLEEDLELHLGEAGRNWERPAPPPIDVSVQSLGLSPPMHAPPCMIYIVMQYACIMHHVCKVLRCFFHDPQAGQQSGTDDSCVSMWIAHCLQAL